MSGLRAALVLGEALGLRLPPPFAPPAAPEPVRVGGMAGHRYGRAGRDPLLLVPGATERGLADERVRRTAAALARAGRTVFVPELVLYWRRFDLADLDGLRAATAALHAESRHRVTLVGVSFGGGLALRTAAEPDLAGAIERVAVLGTYFDLIGLVQAATTGWSVLGGERLPWRRQAAATELVARLLAEFAPAPERAAVQAAILRSGPVPDLSADARALVLLGCNDDPDRVAALTDALGPQARATLRRFSPAAVAERLRVPVLALHATDDPAVPYAESLRLVRAVPGSRLTTVSLFEHVDLAGGRTVAPRLLGDFVRLWRFTAAVLAPPEASPRSSPG